MRHTAHPKNVKSSWGERVDNLSPPFPYVQCKGGVQAVSLWLTREPPLRARKSSGFSSRVGLGLGLRGRCWGEVEQRRCRRCGEQRLDKMPAEKSYHEAAERRGQSAAASGSRRHTLVRACKAAGSHRQHRAGFGGAH